MTGYWYLCKLELCAQNCVWRFGLCCLEDALTSGKYAEYVPISGKYVEYTLVSILIFLRFAVLGKTETTVPQIIPFSTQLRKAKSGSTALLLVAPSQVQSSKTCDLEV